MFKTSNIGIAIKNRQLNSTGPKKPALTKDNSFLVFPFNLIAGYITSTENGLKNNDNVEISDYSNFQRIFTGLESMIAQWDGAYNVEKKDPADTFLTKEYKVGRNFKAFIPNETMGASFEPSSISNDFLAEYTDEEFVMHSYNDIEERDLFRLFIVPELREYKWLYISNAERYFHNGKFHHIEITMTTLNNKVAKSGGSIESFIQRSAPGEGYAWPLVNTEQVVSLDEIRTRDVPITSGQIEMAGPAGFNTIVAYGRPTIQKVENGITQGTFNPKIEAPRLLLPLHLETPVPSPENTRPSAETDFYVGDFQPTLHESYKDWKAQFAGSYNLEERNSYEGVLISGKTLDELRASNPVASGSHSHILWDKDWKIQLDKEYNTASNSLTGNKITLAGEHTVPELLSHQFFATSYLTSLPLTVQQNVAWSLNNVPIVGGFASKLTIGVPFGWNDLSIKLAMDNVLLAIPSSLAEYGNVLKGDGSADTKVWIPLETFTGQKKDEAIESSGINATGTIIKVQYTHRFSKLINNVEYIFDTKDLGQIHPTTDDNGKTIAFADPTQKPVYLLWDGTCKPANRGNTPGYVIDLTHFKTLARLEYRQTFFSNDVQAWTGTYQTKALFTTSIRDWVNSMKLSHWVETNQQLVEYPKAIVAPNPPNVNFPVIQIQDFIDKKISAPTLKDILSSAETQQILDTVSRPAKGKASQFEVGVSQVLNFDTTPVGGINVVKQSYKSLSLSLSNLYAGNITEPINLDIDVDQLITSGTIKYKLATFATNPYYRINYNGFTEDLIVDQTKTSGNNELIISINGNVIEVRTKNTLINQDNWVVGLSTATNAITGSSFQTLRIINGNYVSVNENLLKTETTIKKATLIPKTIV